MRLDFDAGAHAYRLNDRPVPSVTDVLAVITDFSGVPPDVLEAARLFGANVHAACHLFNQDALDWSTLDTALVPYVEQWKLFLEDTGAIVIASEQPVAHEKLGYAGTPDCALDMRGRLFIPDLKSTSVVPPTVGPQTAAYAEAYHYTHGGRRPERCCIHLQPDKYRMHPRKDSSDWTVFLSCLNVYNWRGRYAARV